MECQDRSKNIRGPATIMTISDFHDKKKKENQLNLDAQRLILELAIVNRIQNGVVYANAYHLRSFKLHLIMEEEGDST